ncbi:Arginine/lysine/ornithine decarboxylase [Natronincola peptidivorans]|uniref:Arginine/lysine/ornithine decarboxylase n=1 Tax=Natronincola peptidivorans TaxID=426128 RepID=A0A1I0CUM8_9FIRM|nr:aminotransferase class I/II-fold pyridoxal phosphate-dependent enzyme [Natronincola peptidivorans]SET22993.1 Arginine/lysine/ornithine decarboxylase [Natronincola peptidivorans]
MTRLNQTQTPIFTGLKDYHRRNIVPFDVPGHKHGRGLREFTEHVGSTMMEIDVNSMKCLDNICNPIGVIREAEELAAEAFHADNGFFLVNGTTSGIQAMVMSACRPGEKIILSRNAHKSSISAIILSGAIPIYVQPKINESLGIAMGITVEDLEKTIASHPDAKAVMVINPTYYGATSDLKEIVSLVHRHGMLVLADEAHGAHFSFHEDLPISAMEAGADMSAVSTHKTGGSLTQSSLLLLRGDRISPTTVKKNLNLTQTTSASYLLMASIDVARKQLAVHGKEMLERIIGLGRDARKQINEIDGLYVFGKELIGTPGVFGFDETKLGISAAGIGLTGFELYDLLRDQYNIQIELADYYNILAILSLGDGEDQIETLVTALKDIAKNHSTSKIIKIKNSVLKNPEVIVSPRDAYYSNTKIARLEEAAGEISGEAVMAYPPGIPIIAPGERVTQEIVDYIFMLKREGSLLQGTEDPYVNFLKVLGQRR